jgi:hypothetical protein
MRTYVTFQHPAEFVGDSEDGGGVLAVGGAHWFGTLLQRVSGLWIDKDPCQEDWGVVFFARRNRKKFWIGLSSWDGEGTWVAHFHHGAFAWLQLFSSSRKNELKHLLTDVHSVLTSESTITAIAWHEEGEMGRPRPVGFPSPG